MRPLEAYESVMRFAAERGEAALRLALHAAVPQSFRPDLLHLLRLNFVPEASWEDEADVLLARFCEDAGSGYYQFDAEVRRLLLDQLDPTYPDEEGNRIRRVADFLVTYLGSRRRSFREADRLERDFVSIQGWVALSFLNPEAAALQLAAALDLDSQAGAAASRLQFGGLASALSVPLARYSRLLSYAAGVEALKDGRVGEAVEILGGLPDEEVEVGRVRLRSPRRLLTSRRDPGRAVEVPKQGALARGRPPTIFLSCVHQDRAWVDRLRAHLEGFEWPGAFEVWDDGSVKAGEGWTAAFRDAISRAQVAVLFVSPYYLSSPFIIEQELPSILAQKERGLSIVSLLVRSDLRRDIDWLASSSVWPRNGEALDRRRRPQAETELAGLASEILKMVRPAQSELSRTQSPRVILFYTHASEEHVRRARELVGRLSEDGIDCAIDPGMARDIREADFVLVVLGKGRLGLEDVFLEYGRGPDRFIPILFEDLPEQFVPALFRGFTRYRVYRKSGYRSLVRRLTQQADGAGAMTLELEEAVADLRNVGTGMWVWYKDTTIEPRDRSGDETAPNTAAFDVSKVPIISHAALERLLVPRYLRALPETDPWGHAYEFRLDTEDPGGAHVMAVRSAGADGEFSGDVYEVGDFPPAETAQDLVWADGYFVRWPRGLRLSGLRRPPPSGEGAQHW
jgi:hypothetical protein